MSKKEYNKMIKEYNKMINEYNKYIDDTDFSFSIEEKEFEILVKFVEDVSEGNIKTKKEIVEISKLIKNKVIDAQPHLYEDAPWWSYLKSNHKQQE